MKQEQALIDTEDFILSIQADNLKNYVSKQLAHFFPDNEIIDKNILNKSITIALNRLYVCFSRIKSHYFQKDNKVFFNHLHGDHYSMFLYLLGNTAFKNFEAKSLATKTFLLNKALFGIDAFYAIELPTHFIFVHPIGTILGNATYNDYFVVYQNCTIGSKTDGHYPSFGIGTILYAQSSVIGNCTLGDNTIIAANTSIVDVSAPQNTVITGAYPNNKFHKNKKAILESYFSIPT